MGYLNLFLTVEPFDDGWRAVTLQGVHEERLVRNILNSRGDRQKLSRPVAEENESLDVEFAVALHHIIKVVRIANSVPIQLAQCCRFPGLAISSAKI